MCRQVANLEAQVFDESILEEEIQDFSMLDTKKCTSETETDHTSESQSPLTPLDKSIPIQLSINFFNDLQKSVLKGENGEILKDLLDRLVDSIQDEDLKRDVVDKIQK